MKKAQKWMLLGCKVLATPGAKIEIPVYLIICAKVFDSGSGSRDLDLNSRYPRSSQAELQ